MEEKEEITHLIQTLVSCLLHRSWSRFITASRLTSNTNWSSQATRGRQNGFLVEQNAEEYHESPACVTCPQKQDTVVAGCQVCCVLAMTGV